MIGWLLDTVPVGVWAGLVVLLLVVTWQFWAPIWAILPGWAKLALGFLAAVFGAFAIGRKQGAEGAVERERAKNEAAAGELIDDAKVARERQRRANAGGVPDDKPDPFRRD